MMRLRTQWIESLASVILVNAFSKRTCGFKCESEPGLCPIARVPADIKFDDTIVKDDKWG